MLNYLKRVISSQNSSALQEMVRRISERSVSDVERRLTPGTAQGSIAEFRGYVRAVAARPVRRQARLLAIELGFQAPLPVEVITRAIERTVYTVVRSQIAIPAARVGLRIAG